MLTEENVSVLFRYLYFHLYQDLHNIIKFHWKSSLITAYYPSNDPISHFIIFVSKGFGETWDWELNFELTTELK